MAKFNASNALEPLEYNFAPYDDAKGTVPEPTDDQVADFYADLGRTMEKALGAERMEGVDLTNPTDVGKVYMTLTAEDHKAMYEQLLDLHANVCGERPTRDQLACLPFRLRQAFYGMVQEWLRPETLRPATKD